MRKAPNVSILLGIVALFMGTIIWQNAQSQRQNQELISEILERETKNSFQGGELQAQGDQGDSSLFSSPEIRKARAANYDYAIQCLHNYETWKKSNKFKADTPWSTAFMQGHFGDHFALNNGSWTSKQATSYINNFERDINGDGLPDYVYVHHTAVGDYTAMRDCVHLSNGQGWSLAYRCVTSKESGGTYFYGDCAG